MKFAGRIHRFGDHINTDVIIPTKFLSQSDPEHLAKGCFSNVYPGFAGRVTAGDIVFAGDNFGCGSSREHAPWALTQFGFRAVISTSFADIFKGNSLKNSLLPIVVPTDVHTKLFALPDDAKIQVDLASQTITLPDSTKVKFPVDPFSKTCLLQGIDELGWILKQDAAIASFEAGRLGSINTLS